MILNTSKFNFANFINKKLQIFSLTLSVGLLLSSAGFGASAGWAS